MESLFELVYTSAVDTPVLPYQEGLSQLQKAEAEDDCEIPYTIDTSWQHNCSVTVEGRTALVTQGSGPGYAIGLLPLTNGRYTWKVKSCVETDVFWYWIHVCSACFICYQRSVPRPLSQTFLWVWL